MMQDLQRNSGSSCGMVQSNFLGTEFTIYDRGMSGVTALSPKGDRAHFLPYLKLCRKGRAKYCERARLEGWGKR